MALTPLSPIPRPFEETDPADKDFLGETCRRWEAAISPVTALGKRLVILRTGLVLSRQGGALAEFRKPIRFGIAPILGSGRQIMSWIHIDDLCRLYLQAIDQEEWSGVYNAVAPNPASNRVLTTELARRLKGRYFVPVFVPSLLLKMIVGGDECRSVEKYHRQRRKDPRSRIPVHLSCHRKRIG